MYPNHVVFTLVLRKHFLCFLPPFFFFKVQSKIGVRIIHRHALYKGKYGSKQGFHTNFYDKNKRKKTMFLKKL